MGLHQTLGLRVAWTQFHGSPFAQSPPGLHTLQVVSGCDLLSNGSVHGSDRYGYDGRDFISFDLGSGSFVAADGTAQIIKRLWESDGITVPELKHELGHTCVEVLKKHVRYGREALEHKGGGKIPMGMGELGNVGFGRVEFGNTGILMGILFMDLTLIPFPWEFCGWLPLLSHSLGNSEDGSHCHPIPMGIPWMHLSIIPFPAAPNVHVSGKVEHEILTLSCRTYGFCDK